MSVFQAAIFILAEESKPRFDFANLAKSATENDDKMERKSEDSSLEKEAKIISSVIMNSGSLR